MRKLGLWLRKFMYGRYGVDTLYWWLFGLCIALWIAEFILAFFRLRTAAVIVQLIGNAILVYAIFRSLSKNHYKRRMENQRFGRFLRKTKLDILPNRIRERKTHVYKTCPSCKSSLRLPRKPGEHTVRCPKCGNRFSVKIR